MRLIIFPDQQLRESPVDPLQLTLLRVLDSLTTGFTRVYRSGAHQLTTACLRECGSFLTQDNRRRNEKGSSTLEMGKRSTIANNKAARILRQ